MEIIKPVDYYYFCTFTARYARQPPPPSRVKGRYTMVGGAVGGGVRARHRTRPLRGDNS